MKEVLSKLVIGVLLVGSTVTTGAMITQWRDAGAKTEVEASDTIEVFDADDSRDIRSVSKSPSKLRENETDDDDDRMLASTVSVSLISQNSSTTTSTNTSTSTVATFTAASLALHNKPGDCYIAHNGTVYDVSAHAQWQGCKHRGASGGIDITPFFPHPISYLASLPKVGVYGSGSVSGSTNTGTQTSQKLGSRDDDEDDGGEFEDD